MKWKIDIEEVEDAIIDLKDSIELLDEFKQKYKNLIEEINEENSGHFIDSINTTTDEEIDLIQEVVEDGKEIIDRAENYLSEIEDISPWTGNGVYEVDTEVIKDVIDQTKEIMQEELRGNSNKVENEIDEYDEKTREFNHVDMSMDEERKYKNKEEKIQYIKEKREEIGNNIIDYKHNLQILEEADDIMTKLEEELDDLL